MPDIQAFRGLRYDLGHVGSLSDVIAPPYDVIGPALHEQLYKQHPANVVRLELNREEPGDDDRNNRYFRAAQFLKNWMSEKLLFRESDAALYVYDQTFEAEGRTFTRRGFMCRCRLERFGEGKIYPHEETLAGPKADRLLLTRACRANLSQIFGLFPDMDNEAQTLLEQAVMDKPAIEAIDHLGVVHRLWPMTDMKVVSAVTAVMGPKPLFIADGHHRYETACNYRDELAAAGHLDANHPANFVLMMCVSMSDPGLLVLPTHRLFRGLPSMSADELIAKLGDAFACRVMGEGNKLAHEVWEDIEMQGDQGQIGFFTTKDQRWVLASITPAGRKRLAEVAAEHSDPWRSLGVSILHRLVIDTLLAAGDLPKPLYVHSIDEVVEALDRGDIAGRDATGVISTGGQFPLAALVMPATVEHIREISQLGERMPAKSTYFYPKLVSGLVINPLE